MAVMPSAGYKRLAYTSRALHSSIPLWLSVIGLYSPSSTATIGSGRPHGTCSLHCMSSIGLYSLSSTATIGSGRPHGTCSLHCMSSISVYGLSSTTTFGFGRPHGHYDPQWLSALVLDGPSNTAAFAPRSGIQHSGFTALVAPQPSASDDATGLVALAILQPPVPPLVVSIQPIEP